MLKNKRKLSNSISRYNKMRSSLKVVYFSFSFSLSFQPYTTVRIKISTTLRVFQQRRISIPRDFVAAKRPAICMIIAKWSSPGRPRHAAPDTQPTTFLPLVAD